MVFKELKRSFEGEFHDTNSIRTIYATDASAYRETPIAVAIPKSEQDIHLLIDFANKYSPPLFHELREQVLPDKL